MSGPTFQLLTPLGGAMSALVSGGPASGGATPVGAWLGELARAWTGAEGLSGLGGVQVLAAVALVGGLVLLAMGARVLAASVIVAGLATGAVLGLSLGRAAGVGDVGGVPGSMLTCGVGCVAGGLVGTMLIRLAIGAASTATFGVLGLLGSAAVLVVGGALSAPTLPEARERVAGEVAGISREVGREAVREQVASDREGSSERGAGEGLGSQALQRAGERAGAIATDYWSTLPPEARGTIVWSTLGGAVLGLALGTLMPRRAAALVTALAGAGGAIVGARVLAISDPGQWLEPGSPGVVGWLAVWLVLALGGLWVQSRFQRRGGEQASA